MCVFIYLSIICSFIHFCISMCMCIYIVSPLGVVFFVGQSWQERVAFGCWKNCMETSLVADRSAGCFPYRSAGAKKIMIMAIIMHSRCLYHAT